MRDKVKHFVEHIKFQNFIITLIVLSAILFGLETSKELMDNYHSVFKLADRLVISIFIVEISLKIYAYRLSFFTKAWNNFDFIIVLFGVIPASEAFSSLRAFRVLRLLRVISIVPSFRKVIDGLFKSLPGLSTVATIMALIFYIFAILSVNLFGEAFPDWFGSLGSAMFTLFQIMTLESWSMGIVRPVLEVYPYAWIFFVMYILCTTFTILNLFIAVIITALEEISAQEAIAQNRLIIEENRSLLSDVLKLLNAVHESTQASVSSNRKSIEKNREILESITLKLLGVEESTQSSVSNNKKCIEKNREILEEIISKLANVENSTQNAVSNNRKSIERNREILEEIASKFSTKG